MQTYNYSHERGKREFDAIILQILSAPLVDFYPRPPTLKVAYAEFERDPSMLACYLQRLKENAVQSISEVLDKQSVERWMNTPNPALNDCLPVKMFTTLEKSRQVIELIVRELMFVMQKIQEQAKTAVHH